MKNLKKPSPLKKYNEGILAYHDECASEGVDVRVGISSSKTPSVSVTTNGSNVQVRVSTPIPNVPGGVVSVTNTYTPNPNPSTPPSLGRHEVYDHSYNPSKKNHN
jgi:hypothetical protein